METNYNQVSQPVTQSGSVHYAAALRQYQKYGCGRLMNKFCEDEGYDYWKFGNLSREGQVKMTSKPGTDIQYLPATPEEPMKVCEIKILFNTGRVVSRIGVELLRKRNLDTIANETGDSIPCRIYHISTDEVYGALKMNHPEGIEPPFTTKASSGNHHLAYGDDFFYETTKYNPHSPYSAAKASSDHFVRAYHDTYGMPTIVTNCSNNYGPYQFPEKLIPLFINNIRHRKPLPVYGKGENVRDWLFVEDHARAIDLIFHKGTIAETYNIGGFNEWKNIDIIKVVINTVDRLLGRKEGEDLDLITYVTDRLGHDARYAIDSTKLQKELAWEPSLQFEEGIEKTVKWYIENQEWLDNITSGDYMKYYEDMYRS